MSNNLLNDAKLIKTSAVGCAADAASMLQKEKKKGNNPDEIETLTFTSNKHSVDKSINFLLN